MNTIEQFLAHDNNGLDLIDAYYKICNQLLFQEPIIIQKVTNKLKNNIIKYATTNSNFYSDIKNEYTRSTMNTSTWFVDTLKKNNQIFTTSGSSTGEPFSYGVYNKHINFLEDECHYGMILDEFHINKYDPRILILKKLSYNPKHKDFLYIENGPSPYTLHTHKSSNSIRYFVSFDEYIENPNLWIDQLLYNIKDLIPFDIIMITGPIMSLLSNYLIKNNLKIKLGNLISQTGEFMRLSDKQNILDHKYADHVCDHMRCWDGGATFFTCKHNTYHLLDNLSWVDQGVDNKLISTDYFNMSAPFINYWNGDLCEIDNKYRLCSCGRYYRPFKMLESRPFAIKGPTKLLEIKKQIGVLQFKGKINQIQFENKTVNCYLNTALTFEETKQLQNILQYYKINFYE